MGWTVPVEAHVVYVASCHEGMAVRPYLDRPGERCDWRGPERGSHDQAEEDAAEHRRAHARGYRNYNRDIDRANGEPWAHTTECDEHERCVCGADERERAAERGATTVETICGLILALALLATVLVLTKGWP